MTYFQTSLRMISEWHLPQTRVKKYLLKEKILSGYNFRAINSLRIAAKQSDSSMKKKVPTFLRIFCFTGPAHSTFKYARVLKCVYVGVIYLNEYLHSSIAKLCRTKIFL